MVRLLSSSRRSRAVFNQAALDRGWEGFFLNWDAVMECSGGFWMSFTVVWAVFSVLLPSGILLQVILKSGDVIALLV